MTRFKRSEKINNLSASLEDYLETIAMLKKEKKHARVGDIAKSLNVKNSSVNVAINFLAKNGSVMHERYGYVDLTHQGKKIAYEVQKKHDILNKFLNKLLFIDTEIAAKEACEIEHAVSVATTHRFERLYMFLNKYFFKKDEDIINLKKYLEKWEE
ncbi:MAG: metal-dependent transcriptional regulator [Endomicrobium sp.]|jgi:DtxR family Mn-dependent transcriptional regulator|nr:metal-dependent transcriptional regulator [Endomicrobium sp.]